jgi:ABC-type phosphate transport system substrate-binding protein
MRTPRAILLVLVAMFALTSRTIADEERFKVIVNPANRVDSVSRDLLRDAYLKRASSWSGGETIRPVDLSSKFSVRQRFAHEVVRKTPSQLRSYWNQQIFSGKGVPPPEADSTSDLIAYVLANPGAVGYLPIDIDPGKAKVIRIR